MKTEKNQYLRIAKDVEGQFLMALHQDGSIIPCQNQLIISSPADMKGFVEITISYKMPTEFLVIEEMPNESQGV
jgi:hypothetical protein